jgi:hypothetical protein
MNRSAVPNGNVTSYAEKGDFPMTHQANRIPPRAIFIAIVALGIASTTAAFATSTAPDSRPAAGEPASTPAAERAGAPDTAVANRADTRTVQVRRTVYVCPMHPRVRSKAPGNCSTCGMTLERRVEVVRVPIAEARADTAPARTAPAPSAAPDTGSASGASSSGHSCCATPRTKAR